MDIEIVQLIAKITFMYIGVHYSLVNFGKMKYGTSVSFYNFAYQTTGIVGFVLLQWVI